MRALFALLGAAVAAGLWLIATGLRPAPPTARRRTSRLPRPTQVAGLAVSLAGALIVAAVVGIATGWPVGGLLAAVGVLTLPPVLGPDRAQKRTVARIEAIAAWAEDLAGTLGGAAGIEQAIVKTAQVPPPEIRGELLALAAAIGAGIRLPVALRAFAADLADPTADLVVNTLLQASQHQSRNVAAGLAGVGRKARRHATARMQVAASRARNRTATRLVIAAVLSIAALLVVFGGDFLAPYDTAAGQAALAGLGTAGAGMLWWMTRMGRIQDLPRILTAEPERGPR